MVDCWDVWEWELAAFVHDGASWAAVHCSKEAAVASGNLPPVWCGLADVA
jgi:hypothetical protein